MSIYLAIIITVVVAMGFQVGNTFQKVAADRLPKLTLPVKARAVIAFFLSPMWMAAFGLKVACWVGYLIAVALESTKARSGIGEKRTRGAERLGWGFLVGRLFLGFLQYLGRRLSVAAFEVHQSQQVLIFPTLTVGRAYFL